jgi:hypothetical protein
MRYLKNQFRGRIGRTILEKKRQKSSPLKKIRALNAVFIRVLAVVLRGHIGETRMF